MKTNVKVDRKKFEVVKILQKSGSTIQEMADYMGLSTATIKYIRKAETFDEYKSILAAIVLKKKEREQKKAEPVVEIKTVVEEKPVVEETKTVNMSMQYQLNKIAEQLRQQNEYLWKMHEAMKKQNEIMTLISNKLAFIVDELQ